ncbi:hypothetical protein ACFSJ3_11840 [Corallincola platygyrae]|uniref:DUF943 family protein n=1 Tax=Corallincola platygyrae TaxID=1193278 RepID=A0ABW4XNJ5_9GAMM
MPNLVKRIGIGLVFLLSLILLATSVLYIYLFQPHKTQVRFQTSDGVLSLSEGKDQSFYGVVITYETYKWHCGIDALELRRITPKPDFFQLEWWFDNFDEPKWKVPLVDPKFDQRGIPYSHDIGDCFGAIPEEEMPIYERAQRYIEKLNALEDKQEH